MPLTFARICCQCCLAATMLFAAACQLCADDQNGTSPPLGPSPDDVLTSFQHDPAVRVELAAAEPVVVDPVALCFDEAGRLFVAEMGDYPVGPGDDPQAVSRIKLLSDTDGDGHYESAQVFADNLSFVTGLTPWQNGLVVTLAGEVCWLADTDGDGQADTRESWFQGFTEENTQLRANHPTLAPDGTFFVANGLRGGDVLAVDPRWQTKADAPPVSIRGRDFRFDPFGRPLAAGSGSFEAVTGNGQFGLSVDDFGTRFFCSNRNPCVQVMLEDTDLRRNPAAAIASAVHDVSPAGEQSRIYPISSGWTTSNLHAGQFSAACGVTISRGNGLPAAFHGNAFTCDPTGNLVHRQQIERHGLAFHTRPAESEREFLASSHTWFRPVALADGPDGSLYVIDMARAVIEHPQFMPDELKTRPDLLHGRNRGRLWRITSAGGPQQAAATPLPATASTDELVTLLSHANGWHRDTAARLLLEQPTAMPVERLREMVIDGPTPTARSRSLWLLAAAKRASAKDALDHVCLTAALNDDSPRVRQVAVRLAETLLATDATIRQQVLEMAEDPDAGVRGEVAMRLATIDVASASPTIEDRVVAALATILSRSPADPWIRDSVSIASAGRAATVLSKLLPQLDTASPEGNQTLARLTELAAADAEAEQLADVAVQIAETVDRETDACRAFITGLGKGLSRRRERIETTAPHWPPAMQTAVETLVEKAADSARDERVAPATRAQAVTCLSYAPAGQAVPVLASLLGPAAPQNIRLAAISAARSFDDARLDPPLLADLGSQTPAVHRAVVESLAARTRSATQLLERLESGDLPPMQLSDAQWKRLASCEDGAAARVAVLQAATAPEGRQQVIARYQAAARMDGSFERGRELFRSQCSSCHRVAEIGVNVGPDISDSRVKQPAQYIADILDPNRAVDASFFGYTLLTTDGRLLTGIITAETGSSVTFRQPDGVTVTLLRDEIDELRSTGRSLMPVGLEQTISPDQMTDLITFLKTWRYASGEVTPGPQAAATTSNRTSAL